MALLQLENFSLSVGATQLLDGVSAQITDGQRIALVGPNGSGKSTLLRALAALGHEDYFTVGAGSVKGPLSDLRQPQGSIFLVAQDALRWSELLAAAECTEDELRELTLPEALDMAAAAGGESSLADAETWRRLSVAARDLLGWGMAAYDTTPIAQLSPGCAKRAYLAVALHRHETRLLLLDEPTNHLDLPSILWLRETILATGKAVVVVSHDGAFLDAVADHLWDINPQQHSLTVSGASFSAFQRAKELAREQQRAAYDAQQKRHKHLTEVADSLRAASTSGAQHKARDHDVMQREFRRDRAGRSGRKAKAVETMRDAEPRVERVVDRMPLRINLDFAAVSHDTSIILGDAVLGYEGHTLSLPPISLRIDFGERVVIMGFNGVGKSTLLRTISKEIHSLEGDVTIGRKLLIGNLMQEHELLPRDETPRRYTSEQCSLPMFEAGGRLMRYGLTRQQVDCSIGQLNPGARARALLASFSLRKVNTLILDEPTNHLDEEAMGEVISTLAHYRGTVIVVSHDVNFLKSLEFTHILSLSPTGLCEIDSVDAFVDVNAEAVRSVMANCF